MTSPHHPRGSLETTVPDGLGEIISQGFLALVDVRPGAQNFSLKVRWHGSRLLFSLS